MNFKFPTNFKFLLAIALMVGMAGCTLGTQDINTFVQQLPQVKQFLAQYPNANLSVVLLDEQMVQDRMDRIEEACGFPVPVKKYYFVTVDDPPETVYVLVTPQQEVQCLVRFGPGSPSGLPAPAPPTAPTLTTPYPAPPTPTLPASSSTTPSTPSTQSGTNVPSAQPQTPSSYVPTHDPSQASIYGTITNLQGQPEEAIAFLIELDGDNWNREIARMETEPDGYYELPKVPAGDYQFFVIPDRSALHTEIIELTDTAREYNIQLQEPQEVTVATVDRKTGVANPLPYTTVLFLQNGLLVLSLKTDGQGILNMPQLAAGQYQLWANTIDLQYGPVFAFADLSVPGTPSQELAFIGFNGAIIVNPIDTDTQTVIPNANVQLSLEKGYRLTNEIILPSGEHMYSGLPAVTKYHLIVSAPGYQDFSQVVQIDNQPEVRVTANMVK